jgi:predicted amidohydrolase
MSEPSTAIVASSNLKMLAMDFDKNLCVVERAILLAKEKGATIFCSSELCLSGYSCEDHFLEMDTFTHSIESLAKLLKSGVTDGILCAIGCPIMHKNVRYNCVVMCVNSKIVLIRPKMILADDGNYREGRFFTAYKKFTTEAFELPRYPFLLSPQQYRSLLMVIAHVCLLPTVTDVIFVPSCPCARAGSSRRRAFDWNKHAEILSPSWQKLLLPQQ